MKQACKFWPLIAVMLLSTGCVDGPLYALKQVNPYYRSQWAEDRELGPTFKDRLAELELVRRQMPSMTAAEQAEWATKLESVVANDLSPEIRSRAVRALESVQHEAATRALNTASADDSEKVRLAACQAWRKQQSAAARDMLLSLAKRSDETTSVRQAAIESLAVFDQAEVQKELGGLLDDTSPAIQYQVAQSLKTMTGRDYAGDFSAWKQYLAGQDVPEPESPALTARVLNSLPSLK